MASCLIIGAGLAGLIAARELKDKGWHITVLEKSRGPGGRMATRRFAGGTFDHGAQFFTTRSPAFTQLTEKWQAQGLAKVWSYGFAQPGSAAQEDGHPRYCGVAGMNALPKSLASELVNGGVDILYNQRVEKLAYDGRQWTASAGTQAWIADLVILTSPVPQSLSLLQASALTIDASVQQTLEDVRYERCVTALLVTDPPPSLPPPGVLTEERGDAPIVFLSDNHRKGISERAGCLTAHSSGEAADQIWEMPDREVAGWFGTHVAEMAGAFEPTADWQIHRWRFSKAQGKFDDEALLSQSPGPIIFAGEVFAGSRVEGAFLSGIAAARLAN